MKFRNIEDRVKVEKAIFKGKTLFQIMQMVHGCGNLQADHQIEIFEAGLRNPKTGKMSKILAKTTFESIEEFENFIESRCDADLMILCVGPIIL